MHYSVTTFSGAMASGFRDPAFRLGVQASDVMEAFYRALQPTQRLVPDDMLTFGGNSYGDLKLTINTFGGNGRIDITARALIVEMKNIGRFDMEIAREHLQLCEDTLRITLEDVRTSERLLRNSLLIKLHGDSDSADTFLSQIGNAAFRLNEGRYANLKKEFTLQFSGLDTERAAKTSLLVERSRSEGDLYIQFDYTYYGSPDVTQSVSDQFQDAERELQAILTHLGLDRHDDASQP